jgi:hypothetical protein
MKYINVYVYYRADSVSPQVADVVEKVMSEESSLIENQESYNNIYSKSLNNKIWSPSISHHFLFRVQCWKLFRDFKYIYIYI